MLEGQDDESFDYLFKLVIVGDSGAGKSNIMTRFASNKFFPNMQSTIGIAFATKCIYFDPMTKRVCCNQEGQPICTENGHLNVDSTNNENHPGSDNKSNKLDHYKLHKRMKVQVCNCLTSAHYLFSRFSNFHVVNFAVNTLRYGILPVGTNIILWQFV